MQKDDNKEDNEREQYSDKEKHRESLVRLICLIGLVCYQIYQTISFSLLIES